MPPIYRVRDQTPPLDYGLSHPIKPTIIETDPSLETCPAYIAATSLSSKRRGFRHSWIASINGFNFIGLGVGVPMNIVLGNTSFEVVLYGRLIEEVGAGACIVNRQECMDWKDKFEGDFEERMLLRFSKIRHVCFPVQEFRDNSQSSKISSGLLATCCQETEREVSVGATASRAALNCPEGIFECLSNCSALFSCACCYGQTNTGLNPSETLGQRLDDHAGVGGRSGNLLVFIADPMLYIDPRNCPEGTFECPNNCPAFWRLAARKQDERLALERRLAEPHLVRRSLPNKNKWSIGFSINFASNSLLTMISVLEIILRSSVRNSREFKRELSLCAFQYSSKAKQEEEGKAFGTLSSWLWE
ncbi:uncharacterized protein Bfra_008431 [Botrytis fragariae]|uniref:Uncharacterized protein n=1 Tax=Botrytis fragariae TaxID=1964551 RepID=A0A8H6EI69_9HELO|nr:uncharacterized protein Bfra_008431 [Botrytis fragariae]KAF5873153.1 hypothetical protein Bfra_008431 [Botrytis fragariae]